ncbi:MAG: divalent-cation tolerance protein CutA [Stackebrandtia sp.]
MDDICEVIITGPDAETLAAFTRRLIEERLCACGQHVTQIRSLYRWDGQVQDDPEARVALHTRLSLVPAICELADQEHPYDVPCVIALPVTASHAAYRRWVIEETREP